MKKYRAIRRPGTTWWGIEEFDTEFQVASEWHEIDYNYKTKELAEEFIRDKIIRDKGEVGDWIDGSV